MANVEVELSAQKVIKHEMKTMSSKQGQINLVEPHNSTNCDLLKAQKASSKKCTEKFR